MLIAAKLLLVLFLLVAIVLSMVGLMGGPLAFLAALIFAWWNGFELITANVLLVLLALAVMAELIEFLGGTLGAKTFNASRQAVVGSLIGLIAGLLLGLATLQLYLIPLGLIGGVVAGELIAGRTEFGQIMKSIVGVLIGKVGGILIKSILTFTMVVIILIRIF